MAEFRLATERLVLRAWHDSDVPQLGAMCRDLRVMEFLGPSQTDQEVATAIDRQRVYQENLGHCYWAVERRSDGAFLGFCGLQPEPEAIPVIGGMLDIGWRLAYCAWGQGYACEAALASLTWGFAQTSTDSIWAITVPANRRSWGLMERLGMTRRGDLDFEHPALSQDSPLRPHITYQVARSDWPPE